MSLFYAVEDELSRIVLRRILKHFASSTPPTPLDAKIGGASHLRVNLGKYADLAKRSPVIVLTDLDRQPCPPSMRSAWFSGLGAPPPSNLVFCIAVRETEAWLLADRSGFSRYFKISESKTPPDVEVDVLDPKEKIVQLARYSKSREIREDIVPKKGSPSKTGLGYNTRLSRFVDEKWDIGAASERSPSLRRAIERISAIGDG